MQPVNETKKKENKIQPGNFSRPPAGPPFFRRQRHSRALPKITTYDMRRGGEGEQLWGRMDDGPGDETDRPSN